MSCVTRAGCYIRPGHDHDVAFTTIILCVDAVLCIDGEGYISILCGKRVGAASIE